VISTPVLFKKRSERRQRERTARSLVRDRERLALLSVGGSRERPIAVASASVVEVRVRHLACPQCDGQYKVADHRAPESGIRAVNVRCQLCGVARVLWFRLVSVEPS
jgi:predicted Zn finger-like uncharacterized protein